MNLAKYLHLRWADSPDLNELLPVENVFTGMSGNPAPPYAAISKESERPFTRHNDGSALAKAVMRIQVFHGEYDAGAAVLQEIKSTFDRTAFDLDDGEKVLDMRRIDDREKQLDAGLWQFTVDFECLVYLPDGA